MLKLDGAFAPVPAQRDTGYYRGYISPPERFLSTQLSGGLMVLYKKLREKKKGSYKQLVSGSHTSEDGKFQPCYPAPLLAGRYKFVQIIGEGQSSVLITAEDTFHPEKKRVAVKVMNLDYTRLGAQEADCIQQLNKADRFHVSRTIHLFNVFRFDGHHCLVFELLRPRPLHHYFQKCQFDDEEAKLKVIRKITLQLLQALGFLKRENVIHADLKPENILFEEGEEIKIKVVDFGNAIHWVHKEVSLYYDEFELQTLLYRAPEVMFGVPFGPEIDIWSLGCVLAELYIGKPLFLGRNKTEVLEKVTSVLGPIPRSPFHTGKFFQDLSQFAGHNPDVKSLTCVASLMRTLHNSRNYTFASFLVGLLQYHPSERLTPYQAALHPFLAPECPLAYLLPQQGDEIPDAGNYTDISIAPGQYRGKPFIDEDIKRQHFSGTELLKKGTNVLYMDQIVYPSLKIIQIQTKEEADVREHSPATSLSPERVPCSNEENITRDEKSPLINKSAIENSRYAMEGPLATGNPTLTRLKRKKYSSLHKENPRNVAVDGGEKETYVSFSPTLPSSKNLQSSRRNPNKPLCKMNSKEAPDVIGILQTDAKIAGPCNEFESASVKLNSTQAFYGKRGSDVMTDSYVYYCDYENCHERSSYLNKNVGSANLTENQNRFKIPRKLGFDVNFSSLVGEANTAARTRVYHRKTKSRKLLLYPEIQQVSCSKRDDPTVGDGEKLLNKSQYLENKITVPNPSFSPLWRIVKRQKSEAQQVQDSERTASTGKYQDDEVMLLGDDAHHYV